jgi:hypothetical protein
MVADADVTPLINNTAPAMTLRKRITPSPVTPAANFFCGPRWAKAYRKSEEEQDFINQKNA